MEEKCHFFLLVNWTHLHLSIKGLVSLIASINILLTFVEVDVIDYENIFVTFPTIKCFQIQLCSQPDSAAQNSVGFAVLVRQVMRLLMYQLWNCSSSIHVKHRMLYHSCFTTSCPFHFWIEKGGMVHTCGCWMSC